MSALRRYAPLRRLQVVLGLALMGLMIAPSLAVAQAGPLDSAVGSGSTAFFSSFQFSVTSGPSGENPSGTAVATVSGFGTFTATKISCVSVSGNTATFTFQLAPNSISASFGKVTVVDNGTSGDTYAAAAYTAAPTCSPISVGCPGESAISCVSPQPLTTGDITVFDAPPLPTSKDQCKHGGWPNYPQFKNQGDCVSFVNNGK